MKEYIISDEVDESGLIPIGADGRVKIPKFICAVYEDTPELVRCKHCKYFMPRSVYGHGLCDYHCNGAGERSVVSEWCFCSWGQKR